MSSTVVRLVTILITAPSKEVALNISKTVVSEKLAACVNILPSVTSVYEWEGKLEQSEEVLMVAKTTDDKVEYLEKKVHELHPYEVPEFVVVPIQHAAPKYAAWIRDQMNSVSIGTSKD